MASQGLNPRGNQESSCAPPRCARGAAGTHDAAVLQNIQSLLSTAEPIIAVDPQYSVEDAAYSEFPFIVSIGRKHGSNNEYYTLRQGHFCGGSLITEQYVLTAAHCLEDEKPARIRVLVGKSRFSDGPTSYDVFNWTTYNDWGKKPDTETDHDVAVLKLKTPVTDEVVKIPPLYPDFLNKDIFDLWTAGWGKRREYTTSPALVKARLRVIPNRKCEQELSVEANKEMLIKLQHMCSRSPQPLHLGPGDSGGPVILIKDGKSYIVGVNEAYNTESKSRINTHSRISYYRKFISDMIKK